MRDKLFLDHAESQRRLTEVMDGIRGWLVKNRVMKKLILIVDNDPQDVALLERSLAPLGDITIARRYDDAVDLIHTRSFDLFVIDLCLDERQWGMDLIREIRHHSLRPLSPVIIVSAANSEVCRVLAQVTGANAYVEKVEALEKLQDLAKGLLQDAETVAVTQ